MRWTERMRRPVFPGRKSKRRICPGDAPLRQQATGQTVEPSADRPPAEPGRASVEWVDRAMARALAWEGGHLASQSHLSLPNYPSPSVPPIPQTRLAEKW